MIPSGVILGMSPETQPLRHATNCCDFSTIVGTSLDACAFIMSLWIGVHLSMPALFFSKSATSCAFLAGSTGAGAVDVGDGAGGGAVVVAPAAVVSAAAALPCDESEPFLQQPTDDRASAEATRSGRALAILPDYRRSDRPAEVREPTRRADGYFAASAAPRASARSHMRT